MTPQLTQAMKWAPVEAGSLSCGGDVIIGNGGLDKQEYQGGMQDP